jgi:hypothetical protein
MRTHAYIYISVRNVIHALGLTRLFASESQYWTPDRKRRRRQSPPLGGGGGDNDKNDCDNKSISLMRLRKKPSSSPDTDQASSSLSVYHDYPTKLSPAIFFDSLLSSSSSSSSSSTTNSDACHDIVLIDDSKTILAAIGKQQENHHNMRGILVTKHQSLLHALCLALFWIDADFTFSAERYLRCKNVVDVQSLHRPTWQAFVMAVVHLVSVKAQEQVQQQQQQQEQERHEKKKTQPPNSSCTTSLTLVDVGAGLLSMLVLVLGGGNNIGHGGHGTEEASLPSLWQKLKETRLLHQLSRIDYYAYEPNRELEVACTKVLQDLGFDLQEQRFWDAMDRDDDEDHIVELVFVRKQAGPQQQPLVTVYLRFWDYERPTRQNEQQSQPSPDVIVGCCFADLVSSPNDLVRSLYRCFLSKPAPDQHQHLTGSAIMYFPITFSGMTQLLPPQPLERHNGVDDEQDHDGHSSSRVIPSDTTALALYARALEEQHGHNLDPTRLEEAMKDYGAELLSRGRSDWVIEPGNLNAFSATRPSPGGDDDDYFWQTMMFFFGTTACPQIQVEGFDATAWIRRARLSRATIHASNVDLLFRAPFIGHWKPDDASISTEAILGAGADTDTAGYEEIQFTAPNTVTTIHKLKEVLKGNQVRVRSVCSLISSVSCRISILYSSTSLLKPTDPDSLFTIQHRFRAPSSKFSKARLMTRHLMSIWRAWPINAWLIH